MIVGGGGCPAHGRACGTGAGGAGMAPGAPEGERRAHVDAHPVDLQVVDATEVQLAIPTRVRYGEAQHHGHLGSGSGEQVQMSPGRSQDPFQGRSPSSGTSALAKGRQKPPRRQQARPRSAHSAQLTPQGCV